MVITVPMFFTKFDSVSASLMNDLTVSLAGFKDNRRVWLVSLTHTLYEKHKYPLDRDFPHCFHLFEWISSIRWLQVTNITIGGQSNPSSVPTSTFWPFTKRAGHLGHQRQEVLSRFYSLIDCYRHLTASIEVTSTCCFLRLFIVVFYLGL